MAKPSKAVMAFMEKYSVDSDEIWEVHGSTWVVKHKALERVAAEQGIQWDKPELKVCDLAGGLVVVLTSGKLGDHVEYSFGEATPKNSKNAYPVAMAEKRAKDRVILKLLATHGALYSEAEADEFIEPKRQNPHVNRAEEFHETISDDIKPSEMTQIFQPKMKVKDSRVHYAALLKEMQRIQDPQELYDWGQAKRDEIYALSGDWPVHFKGEYTKHKQSISNGKAA